MLSKKKGEQICNSDRLERTVWKMIICCHGYGHNTMWLTVCAKSYDHGKKSTPVLYFSQWEIRNVNRIIQIMKYICKTVPPFSPRPNSEYNETGMNRAAQLSRPWSKSSPLIITIQNAMKEL